MIKKLTIVTAVLLSSCGSQADDLSVVTLYRSPVVGTEIIHVATFDAADGRDYNDENCRIVADLMRSQPGVTVQYWCQPGRAQH